MENTWSSKPITFEESVIFMLKINIEECCYLEVRCIEKRLTIVQKMGQKSSRCLYSRGA